MTALAGSSPPHPVFKDTQARRRKRDTWGYRAGFAAYRQGTLFGDNAFIRLGPSMPMYDGWCRGWRMAKAMS